MFERDSKDRLRPQLPEGSSLDSSNLTCMMVILFRSGFGTGCGYHNNLMVVKIVVCGDP
jgi:hypothetical protein